ncbi:MAG: hypothetical protein KIS67_03850 [Verrucomicrobiae bacterium]|nr:hypothetical protein [Verrucomicrobiae bacterium]
MKPTRIRTSDDDQARYTGASPIHLVRAERLRSRFYLTQFDDRGSLELMPHRIVFNGMQGVVTCPGVNSVELARMPFPWFAGFFLLLTLAGALVLLRTGPSVHPMTLGLAVAFVSAWTLVVRSRLLIQIEYTDEAGQPCSLFLISDPPFASSRKATQRLHAEIKAKVFPGVQPP